MASLRLPEPDPALVERAFRLYSETDLPLSAIGRLLGFSLPTMLRRRREWGWPDRRRRRHRLHEPTALEDWPDLPLAEPGPVASDEGHPATPIGAPAPSAIRPSAIGPPGIGPPAIGRPATGPSETAPLVPGPTEIPADAQAGPPATLPVGDLAQQGRRLERLVSRRIDHLEAEAALGRDRDPERTDRRLVQLERLLAQLGKRRGGDDGDTQPPARSVAALRDELLVHLRRLRRERRPRRVDRDADAA